MMTTGSGAGVAGDLRDLLGPDLVPPRYDGGSIANLPPTLGELLGVNDGWASPPLARGHLDALIDEGPGEAVILLLVDGVGANRLARARPAASPLLAPFGEPVASSVLTSVVPATTTVATTVLLANGSTPAQTGVVGFSHLLPRLGVLANVLRWTPAGAPGPAGELERWGLVPEEFLPVPSLAATLAAGGVASRAFLPHALVGTPLSRMQFRGARVDGYLNLTDLLWQLERWLEGRPAQERFAYAYLPDFDGVSHRDGPDTPLWDLLLDEVEGAIGRFLARAAGGRRRGTLLITADHGHVPSPESALVGLQDHRELCDMLAMPPGGEARHVNLYARSGAAADLHAYCRERLDEEFLALGGGEALAAGLYGPLQGAHAELAARVGDVILLARGESHLWDRALETRLAGMHGSLHPDEMLVPLIAYRL